MKIKHNEVHIWCIRLNLFREKLKGFYSVLSSDERIRADNYHFLRDQESFVIARASLRNLLGYYLNIDPKQIVFSYNSYGKPYLELETNLNYTLQFNLSHSENIILLAFSENIRIGIDVEKIYSTSDLLDVAHRYFSSVEYKRLMTMPRIKREKAFFKYWSRKESYIKGLGKGLSIPLNSFDVSIDSDTQPILLDVRNDHMCNWIIYNLDVGSEYAGAIAVDSPSCLLRNFDAETSDPIAFSFKKGVLLKE